MDRAFITTICGGDAYVPGIEALGHSLHKTGTDAAFVVMATPDVPEAARERLRGEGWQVREVEEIQNPHPADGLLFARFARTFTKLRAFEQADIKKAVVLDADTLVLQNIDELFERPHIAAAPDFFVPDRFNSGVLVIEPSKALFAEMMAALAGYVTYDGGDQGFLNSYWPDWWRMDEQHRLPARYNMHHFVFQFLISHPSLKKQFLEEIKIIHYTLQKPWMAATLTGGSGVWWEHFFGAHPEADAAWKRRLHALQDRTFDSVVSLLGGG